jgi:hypothetical protein
LNRFSIEAMAKKKASEQATNEGFLTTAAQAIGATLGQIAKKAGVTSPPVAAKPAPKKATKKVAASRKKAPLKKKAPVRRPK